MKKFFLLADDDRDDAELFGEALSGADPPVEFAHVENGKAVFTFLSSNQAKRPDIIFLDLNMPELTGWQCLSKLQNDIYFKEIPVIMYSTSSNPRDKVIAVELGAVGFITKPSSFKQLTLLLAQIAVTPESELKTVVDNFLLGG